MNTAYYTASLNGCWQLSRFPVGKGSLAAARTAESIPATVPGDIHQAIRQAGEITDPLIGDQINRLTYLEELEWWYRRTFFLPCKEPGHRYVLWFGGIDLHGRIFVNGEEVGETDNAFTPYAYDITDCITAGENELVAAVDCGLHTLLVNADYQKYNPQDPGEQGAPVDWRRVQLRKPQFSFWWDWAKRLITVGLWQDVELRVYRGACIRDLHVWEEFDENGKATVHTEAETDAGAGQNVVFSLDGYGLHLAAAAVTDADGVARAAFASEKLRLWYPNGYGEQPLYDIRAALTADGRELSVAACRHGIRRIELDQSPLPGSGKQRFTLRVNGRAIYCKGGNWVPTDSILANETDEKYESLLRAARDAHYNMLRVWGGGTYERDRFYELCDEYGILLWHDFMFANGYFPTDEPAFRKNVERELPIVIRRLRNYACIAIWCGNNEIHWQHLILQQHMPVFYGQDIYEQLLPRLLTELDGTRPYRPCSPYGRMSGNADADGEGDTHSWYIWLGSDEERALNIENFLTDESHFVSEYGVLSHPNYPSMRQYLCGNVSRDDPAFETHNNFQEIGRINKMLNRYYVDDADGLDMRRLIRFSQYMQGDIYRFSMETFIRRAPDCMGVLYWMFNDCWGCTSWTAIDYYGRKKASWYMIKRAFSPLLASLLCRDGKLRCWVVQNSGDVYTDLTVRFGICTFDGDLLWEDTAFIGTLPAGEARKLPSHPVTAAQQTTAYGFVQVTDAAGRVLYRNTQLLDAYKKLQLPTAQVTLCLADQGDGTELCVTADRYAVNLFIEAEGTELSDNGLDLEPGREYRLTTPSAVDLGSFDASVLNGSVTLIDKRIR